jgi:hypothetical protein
LRMLVEWDMTIPTSHQDSKEGTYNYQSSNQSTFAFKAKNPVHLTVYTVPSWWDQQIRRADIALEATSHRDKCNYTIT